jgi:quinoprotein glucose dehydrogenase
MSEKSSDLNAAHMNRRSFLGGVGIALGGVLLPPGDGRAETSPMPAGEWHAYSGTNASQKYSPLDQINASNVNQLQIAWRRPMVDPSYAGAKYEGVYGAPTSNSYQTTPLMVDGVMYAANGIGLVEAFDAGSAKTIWTQPPPGGTSEGIRGVAPRGIAYGMTASGPRIFIIRGMLLYALDAKTGKPAPEFGENGAVSLREFGEGEKELGQGGIHSISPPVVCRDVVIIGSMSDDNARRKKEHPGDVLAFDTRTGKLRWNFHVIPRPNEFGYETWEKDSASYTGAANVWAPFSADDELGYVYLPTSTPTADWYGGARLGNGLFGESLVCVDVNTGKRVWHFQGVHHGLWDYDFPAAPVLADVTVNGKKIKAVLQVGKTAFLFAFNRVTGEPIWPIEERPVPQSDTPGERSSPTQPFPTKPAPFDRQGFTEDDVIDFTPEIKAEALEMLKQYRLGPIFTPPSVVTADRKGTIALPGWAGGANWGGGAFDPETGIFYVPSITDPNVDGLATQSPEKGDVMYIRQKEMSVPGPKGLPICKPPYGRITAIDMNRGEHVWQVPNGDGPRNHPALKALNLPPLGSSGRVAPLLTKTLLFVGEGDEVIVATPPNGGGKKFRAYDKATGHVVWETEFPGGTTGAPMAYSHLGKQYIVVAIGSRRHAAELVALALPSVSSAKAAQ